MLEGRLVRIVPLQHCLGRLDSDVSHVLVRFMGLLGSTQRIPLLAPAPIAPIRYNLKHRSPTDLSGPLARTWILNTNRLESGPGQTHAGLGTNTRP